MEDRDIEKRCRFSVTGMCFFLVEGYKPCEIGQCDYEVSDDNGPERR